MSVVMGGSKALVNDNRLRGLPNVDKKEILRALLDVWPAKNLSPEISKLEFLVAADSLDQPLSDEELIALVLSERDLMIDVATGGRRIKEVNEEYKGREAKVRSELSRKGLNSPNPYDDLWAWYAKWSADLPTYQLRRDHILQLFAGLPDRIRQDPNQRGTFFQEPTGWDRVDRCLAEVGRHLGKARVEEEFQAVGLLCREVLISVAQTVYDPLRHHPGGSEAPSDTDAKRMLDSYLTIELPGGSNEVKRRYAKVSLDLANELQHQRNASFREAALCAEATAALVNLVAIVSGRRDP